MNQMLLMLKGLPASGKSTFSRELCANSSFKRINKDELRAMLHDSKHTKTKEKFILKARDALIELALSNGFSVVVDDTNLAEYHEATLAELAKKYKATFEIKFFNVSVDECIKRDLVRPNSVGSTVIRRMYEDHLKPKPISQNPHLTKAIICDIDGTLAHMVNRGPFDWAKVGEDSLDTQVASILNKFSMDHYIILLSGRDSICRSETEEWLKKYRVKYDDLFMRPEGNCEKDTIIKRKLFDDHIANKYYVDFVIDDRASVCRMWHGLGLKLFRVGNPDAEF